MEKDINYKDEETGHILFGQAMLDRNTNEIKKNTKAIYIIGFAFIIIIIGIFIFLFWYFHKFNIVGNIIRSCL